MDNYSVRQNKIEHSLDELFFNSYISAAQGTGRMAQGRKTGSIQPFLEPYALCPAPR
jgi:hypothetical protein